MITSPGMPANVRTSQTPATSTYDSQTRAWAYVFTNVLLVQATWNKTLPLRTSSIAFWFSQSFFIQSTAQEFGRSLIQPPTNALSWPPSLKSKACPTMPCISLVQRKSFEKWKSETCSIRISHWSDSDENAIGSEIACNPDYVKRAKRGRSPTERKVFARTHTAIPKPTSGQRFMVTTMTPDKLERSSQWSPAGPWDKHRHRNRFQTRPLQSISKNLNNSEVKGQLTRSNRRI